MPSNFSPEQRLICYTLIPAATRRQPLPLLRLAPLQRNGSNPNNGQNNKSPPRRQIPLLSPPLVPRGRTRVGGRPRASHPFHSPPPTIWPPPIAPDLSLPHSLHGELKGTDFLLWAGLPSPRKTPIPSTLDEYYDDLGRNHWSTLPRGTMLRLTRLVYTTCVGAPHYYAYCIIESGPLVDKSTLIVGFVDWAPSPSGGNIPIMPAPRFF